MMKRTLALAACTVLVAGLAFVVSTQAAGSPLSGINKLTFSGRVALPGVVLLPGTYVFESGPMNTNPNIVRVLSTDRQSLYFVGFTVSIQRPRTMRPNDVISLGEAVAGAPAPIKAWYPLGSREGHAFLYR